MATYQPPKGSHPVGNNQQWPEGTEELSNRYSQFSVTMEQYCLINCYQLDTRDNDYLGRGQQRHWELKPEANPTNPGDLYHCPDDNYWQALRNRLLTYATQRAKQQPGDKLAQALRRHASAGKGIEDLSPGLKRRSQIILQGLKHPRLMHPSTTA